VILDPTTHTTEPATVERRVARALPELMATLRTVEHLPSWYDEWDTVSPAIGTLDQPGVTFTLTRAVDGSLETVRCATVQAEHAQQLRWIEDVGASVATLVTFDLSAVDDHTSTAIRYTRAFIVARPGPHGDQARSSNVVTDVPR
jgi:hypothetical protein